MSGRTRTSREQAHRARTATTPPPTTETSHERAGHRREHDSREDTRRTRTQRTRAAIADVGLYRAVSYKDLSEQHFDGHPFTTRRMVTQMKQAGLIEEHEATGPRGNTFTVLTATERGKGAAQRAAVDAGHVPAAADVERPGEAGRAVARHGRVPRRARRAGAHRGRRRARRSRPH